MNQFILPFTSAGIANFACEGLWRKMKPRTADDGCNKANDAATINLMAEMLYRGCRVAWAKYHLRTVVAGQFHNWGRETHKQIVANGYHTYCQKGCEVTKARAMVNPGVMPASHLLYVVTANIQWPPKQYRDAMDYLWVQDHQRIERVNAANNKLQMEGNMNKCWTPDRAVSPYREPERSNKGICFSLSIELIHSETAPGTAPEGHGTTPPTIAVVGPDGSLVRGLNDIGRLRASQL